MSEIRIKSYPVDALDEVMADWDALSASRQDISLFATSLWAVNYWQFRRHAGPPPVLLAGYEADGHLIGLAPFTREARSPRSFPLATIRAPHSTGEYACDWCCDPGHAAEFVAGVYDSLAAHLRPWFQLSLRGAPEGSSVLEAIEQLGAARNAPFDKEAAVTVPFVDVRDPAIGALELTTGKYRREILRKTRELEKIAPLACDELRSEAAIAIGLEDFLAVEGSGWKLRDGGAIICQPDAEAFWRNLAAQAAAMGRMRLHLLRCGDQTIAGQLGITWGNRYYCLKVGYDETFRRFGPGAIVTQHALQSCIDDPGIQIYDFAGASQPYMKNWTSACYKTYNLEIAHPAMLPRMAFRSRRLARRVLHRFRQAHLQRVSRVSSADS